MYKIGVDGGGTNTRAVLIDSRMQVVGRGEAGSSNHYSVGAERAAQNIATAVDGALQAAGVGHEAVEGWGIGLAGACTPVEQAQLKNSLAPLVGGKPLIVEEDGAAIQSGAFAGGAGVICSAGTGTICFGINERGERARADGLGPLLGDRGSGYWIGEQALRAVGKANDGSGPATLLMDGVLKHLGVASVDELVQLVYRPDFERDRIASLVPAVMQCAAAGDDVANGVLRAAGHELADTARAVLQALGLVRVAVYGGVLGNDTPVRTAFDEALRQSIPEVRVQTPQYDAAVGAALLVS